MTLATSEVVIGRARSRSPSSMALVLIGPATLFCVLQLLVPIAILFRYSLNRFDPAAYMVEAVTAENYVKFFTDPYYLTVLARTIRVSVVSTLICLVMGFPLAYWLARMTSRWKNLMVILVVLPLFIGNAVRAAGWMTLFGAKGFVNSVLLAIEHHRPAAHPHVHRDGRGGRHHHGQPTLYGAHLAERARRHRAPDRGSGAQPRRRALPDLPPGRLAARAPRNARGHHPHLHPRDERLCDAGASRRPEIRR